MSRFRITTTVVVDTGEADVWGLERFHPREISSALRRELLRMQVGDRHPRPEIGHPITVISDDSPDTLANHADTLARAEAHMAQIERDRAAAVTIADELAERGARRLLAEGSERDHA